MVIVIIDDDFSMHVSHMKCINCIKNAFSMLFGHIRCFLNTCAVRMGTDSGCPVRFAHMSYINDIENTFTINFKHISDSGGHVW